MVGIGIIGTGKQGSDHARRIASLGERARLVAVHDRDRSLAASVAGSCGARVAASDEALIEDPEVEAVIVASSTETHVPFVLACIAAGKPVMRVIAVRPVAGSCRSTIRRRRVPLGQGLIEHLARLGKARPALRPRPRLETQFGERCHALVNGATNGGVGDGFTDADVHVLSSGFSRVRL